MNKMNTLAFVNFLLVKLFPTLIRQNFPPSKICAIRYTIIVTTSYMRAATIIIYVWCLADEICMYIAMYKFTKLQAFTSKILIVVHSCCIVQRIGVG